MRTTPTMYDGFEDLGTIDLTRSSSTSWKSAEKQNGCCAAKHNNENENDNDDDDRTHRIRILQLTDLHIFPSQHCESFCGISLAGCTTKGHALVRKLVRTVRPDVIVLTGDIMDGRGPWKRSSDEDENMSMNTTTLVTQAMRELIPHFHGTPWLYIPGNHDDDHSPWERADLMHILQLPGCLQGRARGFHHTVLLTKQQQQQQQNKQPQNDLNQNHEKYNNNNNANKNITVQVRLHLFDSGGNHPDPRIMYQWTPRTAVQGFLDYYHCSKNDHIILASKQQSSQIKNNRKDHVDDDVDARMIVGLVFLHIPTPEYQGVTPIVGANHLFEAALQGGKVPAPFHTPVGAWLVRRLGKDRIAGCARGGPQNDSGLFEACLHINAHNYQQQQQQQSLSSSGTTSSSSSCVPDVHNNTQILAMFCGHDHHSDAIFWRPSKRQHNANNDGLFFGYGRSGAVTPPFDWEGKAPNPLLPGARVLEIINHNQNNTFHGTGQDDTEINPPPGPSRFASTKVYTWIQNENGMELDSWFDMTNYSPKESYYCCNGVC